MRVVDVLSLKSFAALLLSRGLVDLTPLNLDTSGLACKAPMQMLMEIALKTAEALVSDRLTIRA
jgi:hypothetical protein